MSNLTSPLLYDTDIPQHSSLIGISQEASDVVCLQTREDRQVSLTDVFILGQE